MKGPGVFSPSLISAFFLSVCGLASSSLSPDHLLQRFTAYDLTQDLPPLFLSFPLSLVRKTSDRGSDWLAGARCSCTTWIWPVGGLSKDIAAGRVMETQGGGWRAAHSCISCVCIWLYPVGTQSTGCVERRQEMG